ncbi:MAG: ribonuclease Y [Thermoguttaceae bacterium]|nr:ribonuclease Y [Thermoguttaceae bacterium]MBQ4080229.1 ribonuclease Y [Thermoguttaceae bacterium]
MTPITMAVMLIVVALLSGAGVFFGVQYLNKMRKYDAENEAKTILDRAKQDAENYRREAELELKEASIKQKEEIESEKRAIRQAQAEKERQLDKRQIVLDQQGDELRKHERSVQDTRKTLSKKIEEQGRLADELREKIAAQEKALYEVLNLTKEEASRRLLEKLDKELTEEEGAIILRHEKEVNERCESAARKIILLALQRYAAAHTAEATTSTVDIPNDEMKGRVIGREGRNIRAFEKITGVDVIIDDTPGVVIVSAFDAIRREAARLTLTRLIADGRIHPSRIEEIYDQTTRDIQAFVQRVGEEACQEAEVARPHERVVNFLGRLYFRTSYSQNVLRHSIEVAFLSGAIAAEMGLNERLARRCGLLHDLGKAADHELEGGHPKIGADILKRYGEPLEVVQAALKHHEDPRLADPYTLIVAAADACSASRPGARRETLEHYVKRMEELEKIAMEFPFVEQAFAVQAGREMRVIVNSQLTTDESAAKTCRDIVKELTARLQFPGEIKVTVIRETRATDIAK